MKRLPRSGRIPSWREFSWLLLLRLHLPFHLLPSFFLAPRTLSLLHCYLLVDSIETSNTSGLITLGNRSALKPPQVPPPWPPPMFATCWICPRRASPDLIRNRRSSRSVQVSFSRFPYSPKRYSDIFPTLEGITRELYALLGERAPPIAINENRYKGRPKWTSKKRVQPWYAHTTIYLLLSDTEY